MSADATSLAPAPHVFDLTFVGTSYGGTGIVFNPRTNSTVIAATAVFASVKLVKGEITVTGSGATGILFTSIIYSTAEDDFTHVAAINSPYLQMCPVTSYISPAPLVSTLPAGHAFGSELKAAVIGQPTPAFVGGYAGVSSSSTSSARCVTTIRITLECCGVAAIPVCYLGGGSVSSMVTMIDQTKGDKMTTEKDKRVTWDFNTLIPPTIRTNEDEEEDPSA